ncbi:hypothetical protein CF319_g5154 [Tilletia indica]|nr:hypothetical protein CF319_g5154 [Tilletia indica]
MAIFGKRKDKNNAADAAQQQSQQQQQQQQQHQHQHQGSSGLGSGGNNSLELSRPQQGSPDGNAQGSMGGPQGINSFGGMMGNGPQQGGGGGGGGGGPGGPGGPYGSMGPAFLPSQALQQQQAQQAQAVAQGAAANASNGPMTIPRHGSPATSVNGPILRNGGPSSGSVGPNGVNGQAPPPGGPNPYRNPGMNGPTSALNPSRGRNISLENGSNNPSGMMQSAQGQAVPGSYVVGGTIPSNGSQPPHSILMQPGSTIGGNDPMQMNNNNQQNGASGMMGPSPGMSALVKNLALSGQNGSSGMGSGIGGGAGIDGLPASSTGNVLPGGTMPVGSAPSQVQAGSERGSRAPNVVFPWSQRPLNLLPPRFLDDRQQAPPGAGSPSPFPRYGLAVNSAASTSGEVYLFGGLVRELVKNDLYTLRLDAGTAGQSTNSSISAELVQTTGEIPPPRVGHATVLVSNVLILWGGDTKVNVEDTQDAGLYLLNLNTREWTRVKAGTELTASTSSSTTASMAIPASPGGTPSGPCGRYGHSVSIIASRLYVFGGQVDGAFLNDFWCFDLNSLKSTPTWEPIRPANDVLPPRRTGHASVMYKDCIYVFGGTDGQYHYNDTWCYSVTRNEWTELSCIGYIPVPREGHSACLVDDVMYVFGGRGVDGKELGDLASFKITNKRWYMFANMGPAPSGRSGHCLVNFNNKVVVLGGESFTGNKGDDPGMIHVLDTGKIKYPTDPNKGSTTSSSTNVVPNASAIRSGAAPGQQMGDARAKSPEQRAPGSSISMAKGIGQSQLQQQLQQQPGIGGPAQARQAPNLVGMMQPSSGPAVPQQQQQQQQQGMMGSPVTVMSPPQQGAVNPAMAAANAGSPTSVASGSQQQHSLQGAYGKMAGGPGSQQGSQARGVGPGSSPGQPYVPNAAAVRMEDNAAARSMSPTQRTIQEQRIAALNVSAAGPSATAVAAAALQQQQQRAVSPPNVNPQMAVGGAGPGGYRVGGPASQRSLENLRMQAASPTTGRMGGSAVLPQGQRGINGTLAGAGVGVLGDPYSDGASSAVTQPYVIGDPAASNGPTSHLFDSSMSNGPGANTNASAELVALRKREAWMKVALAAALRKGFVPSEVLQQQSQSGKGGAVPPPSSEELAAIEGMSGQMGGDGGDKDKVVKALLALKAKLANAQATIAENAQKESDRVAEVERMRGAAIQEASYFRAKVQAYEMNNVGDAARLDRDRCTQLERQVATALQEQAELERKITSMTEQAKLEQQLRVSAEERLSEAAKRAMAAEAAQMKAYDELSAAQKRSLAAESSLRDHQSQLNSLRSTAARHQSDYESARSNLSDANATVDGHLSALTQVRAALDAATARASEHERLYQTHRDASDQNQGQLLKLRTELEGKNGEISLLNARVAELQSLVDRTRAEADSHRSAATGALAQIINLHQERSARGEQAVRSDAPVPRHIQDKMRALEDEAETLRQLHSQSRTAADSGTTTLNEVRERNLTLEKQHSSLRTELNAVRNQLTTALREVSQIREQAGHRDVEAREARRTAETMRIKMGVLRQHANEAGLRLPADDALNGSGAMTSGSDSSDRRIQELEDEIDSRIREIQDTEHRLQDSESRVEELTRVLEHADTKQGGAGGGGTAALGLSSAGQEAKQARAQVEELQRKLEETSAAYEDKLSRLDKDYQTAIQYVKGTEKMMQRMNGELAELRGTGGRGSGRPSLDQGGGQVLGGQSANGYE